MLHVSIKNVCSLSLARFGVVSDRLGCYLLIPQQTLARFRPMFKYSLYLVLARNRAPGGLLRRTRAQSTQKAPDNQKIRAKTKQTTTKQLGQHR